MKYWFVCFQEQIGASIHTSNAALTTHPFQYAKDNKVCLLYWQEITKKEYELFVSLHKK